MNPQKEHKKIDIKSYHRVIVVVFIPKLEGYYQDMFEVFKLSLESIIVTKNEFCEITVVNNACCNIVVDYLNKMYFNGEINCLINHRINIGKVDALIGAARGSRERLITTTDADILFVKGWQENVENIFCNFRNVGSVSPLPIRTGLTFGTISTLQRILFKNIKLTFLPIKENFISYNKFLESIGWDLEKNDDLLWPVISKKNRKAILGSAHQVLTIDREIFFSNVPKNPSLTLVGNNSEHDYIDTPIDLSGKMRLSTYNNFAFHMGNKTESWMYDIQKNNTVSTIILPNYTIENFKCSNSVSSLKSYCFKCKKKIIKNLFKMFYT